MLLVVDANILIAALLKKSTTRAIMIKTNIQLIAPEFILEEIEKHADELTEKTNVDKTTLHEILIDLLYETEIKIYPKQELEKYLEKAGNISPDRNDAMYFALALKENTAIWSNDTELKTQSTVKVYSTMDIIQKLNFNIH